MLEHAVKDRQTVTPEGDPVEPLIDGVMVREVRHQLSQRGSVTEVFSRAWSMLAVPVDAIIYVGLRPSVVSAWFCHERQSDCIFALHGAVKIVLFDGRRDSSTHGSVNVFIRGIMRPALILIPPGVWHGFQSLGPEEAGFLNMFDHAFIHKDPDQWRLPPDSSEIPYRFGGAAG